MVVLTFYHDLKKTLEILENKEDVYGLTVNLILQKLISINFAFRKLTL